MAGKEASRDKVSILVQELETSAHYEELVGWLQIAQRHEARQLAIPCLVWIWLGGNSSSFDFDPHRCNIFNKLLNVVLDLFEVLLISHCKHAYAPHSLLEDL